MPPVRDAAAAGCGARPRRPSWADLAQAAPGSPNGAAAPAPEHASAAQLEAPSESAPTPWSEPVASPSLEDDGGASGGVTEWDQAAAPPGPADAVPVASPADDWQMQDPATDPTASATLAEEQAAPPEAWSATPQEPVQEWQAESAPSDWQEARKQDAEAVPEAADTHWSSLRSGPHWAASSAPEQPQEQNRGAAAPAPGGSGLATPAPPAAPQRAAPPAAAP